MKRVLLYVAIGTIFMFIPILVQSISYKIKIWKSVIVAILLAITGTVSTYLMFLIENRFFGGISFYGAVFFVPLFFIPIALILKENYFLLTDLCAPAECAMLVIMKIQCLMAGCCRGVILYTNAEGTEVRFPSPIAEMINAIILCIALLILARKISNRGIIYPLYLILYGVSRFILNIGREEFFITEKFLPMGSIWSIVAVIVGIIWIFVFKKHKMVSFTK